MCSSYENKWEVDWSENGSGWYNAVTNGSDGMPVISFHGDGSLKAVHCTSLNCKYNSVAELDPGTGPSCCNGIFTSIAIGSDGMPVISYND